MQHLKELVFTFIVMLIFSRCTVSFKNYSTLYKAYSILLACFHVIELKLYLNLSLLSLVSLKPRNKTALYFYFLLLIVSIQM